MEDSSDVSINSDKLSPFSTLLKSTWQVYRSHIVIFIEIMLLPFIFSLIVYFVSTSRILIPVTGFWFVLIIACLTLVSVFLQLLAYAALIHCTKENLGLANSLRSSWRGLLPFFAVIILASLISLIGFGLLVIPGVIATVWFSLAAFILIYEKRKVIASLLRSRELIRGHFFSVLLRLLGAWIIVAIIILVVLLLVSLIGRIDPSHVSPGNLTSVINRVQVFDALNFSLSNLTQVFTTPFLVVFCIKIYHDLKRLKGE